MESRCINPIIECSVPQWAQELKKYLDSCTEKYCLNWCKIVIEIGVNEIEMDKWVDIFKRKIEERYEDLVEEVSEMKSKLLDDITDLMAKTYKYANELGLKEDLQDINPNERLYLGRKDLTNRMERLSHLMKEREKEIKDLLEEQQELCNMLEKTPYNLSVSPLPPREEIEKLQHFVESLEQEKFDREERYLALKTAIGRMAQEIGLKPRTDFEREILSVTKKNFDITDTNMKNLQTCHDDMVLQLVNMKEEVERLKKTLDDLWEVLEESITKRHSFHEQFDGYSVATLEALRAEVKRCEELKKGNIKVFVEKFRTELRELWRTCFHLNEEKQTGYQWLTSDFYTEDLLSLHEMEISKWKNFYSKNEKLIKLFTEHQALWSHLLEMENKNTAGPNRYKIRGGHLLQEEKERNKLSKKIPLLEDKIKQLAFDYEDLTGTSFLIFGTPIMEYIENLHLQRDQSTYQKDEKKAAMAELDNQLQSIEAKAEQDPAFDRILEEIIGHKNLTSMEGFASKKISDKSRSCNSNIQAAKSSNSTVNSDNLSSKETTYSNTPVCTKNSEVIVVDPYANKPIAASSQQSQYILTNTPQGLLMVPSVMGAQNYILVNSGQAAKGTSLGNVLTESDIMEMPTVILDDCPSVRPLMPVPQPQMAAQRPQVPT